METSLQVKTPCFKGTHFSSPIRVRLLHISSMMHDKVSVAAYILSTGSSDSRPKFKGLIVDRKGRILENYKDERVSGAMPCVIIST